VLKKEETSEGKYVMCSPFICIALIRTAQKIENVSPVLGTDGRYARSNSEQKCLFLAFEVFKRKNTYSIFQRKFDSTLKEGSVFISCQYVRNLNQIKMHVK
jgi:hypothetical protein